MNTPPKVLRIKRKRDQDPLQALILENRGAKRSKPSSQVPSPIHTPRPKSPAASEKAATFYTLSRTDDLGNSEAADIIESVLQDLSGGNQARKRKFVIPNQQTSEDAVIPNELSDMISTYLNVDEESGQRRKKRGKHIDTKEEPVSELQQQVSDYVYDVYYLSNKVPLTSANHPQAQIGYIRFFDDDDPLYQSEDDDKKPNVMSDDEDSNAEDFYQNDYPSDEDAGAFSETQESEDEDKDESDADGQYGLTLHEEDYDYDEGSYLPDDVYYDDSDFQRNKFFESDEHDPLAIHRDRIFGKLNKMIQDTE